MPVLEEPREPREVTLPPRPARHGGRCDVLVVGGGPAGFAAAIGAADTGADVVLAERYGFLGGNATVALVMPLMSFHNEHKQAAFTEAGDTSRLLPTDHGEGEPVVAGVLWQLLDRLMGRGGCLPPSPKTGYTVPFDPELFKFSLLEMMDESGVRMLFHAFASGALPLDDGSGWRVVFETKSGPVVIDAGVVVDGTGDGDVAASCGAPFEIGRPEDGLAQPMTLMFRVADFSRPDFADYVRDHPDQWRGVHGLWDLIEEARAAGELRLPREDILFFATPHPREVAVNSTRVNRVLGTSVWDLTRAEYTARRQLAQIDRFLRTRVPGFEESYVVQSGTHIGVRESRRVLGDYQLTGHDILAARTFPDVIAHGAYPVDIHNPRGSGTVLKRVPRGSFYDIPLRCLVPRGTERLLVAGRCISGTHVAHSSYRVMPIAMATGQAAGVCAALTVRHGRGPRGLPYRMVQHELLRQGARLRT
ncbi:MULTISPECIES: FAD-dependent oxidoreductase [Streptomyces]|uniref:FAD-dependent oxidoreductase n=3 Tax=Streptomyces rochei group TaxID=2867164 RepID=A0ABW7E620_STRRO|nr:MULTISPECIES: FAD-dependent oxidoreductase [Streptomyces]MDV6287544.1 FAD-dependent oxidoreductase [Streptomyces sp. UP1A-1]WDI22212.1 FAD-dependent oxidoreductase [Streptomyces enissocaesilis]KYK15170.1 FAD-dependent oxidoreductase [Streptomyces sp. CC71]MBQ0878570.1 FAD-dependent oxidoreductase [Streptomyces sp. RT42]MBU8553207.1 FAD-dependent oxidoreductase [Streptomyces sp. Osf17]